MRGISSEHPSLPAKLAPTLQSMLAAFIGDWSRRWAQERFPLPGSLSWATQSAMRQRPTHTTQHRRRMAHAQEHFLH